MTETTRAETASFWCLKVAEGGLTPQEEAQFELWLEAAPENREAFRKRSIILMGMPQIADMPEVIAARADALEAMRAANEKRWSRRFLRRFWPGFAVAASMLLLTAGGLIYLAPDHDDYRTGIGERQMVKLEDGSTLSLDAATQVSSDYTRKARVLKLLSGRAKFDVAHDADRPFTVIAGDKTIIATGTSFSVELVNRQVQVILYEGHVRVVSRTTDETKPRRLQEAGKPAQFADQQLTPGKMLVAAQGAAVASIEASDVRRSLAWEGGQLIFSDEPLAVAAERFNRYSDKPIIVEGAAASLPVSGAFNTNDAEGFIDGVRALYALRTAQRGNATILFSAP